MNIWKLSIKLFLERSGYEIKTAKDALDFLYEEYDLNFASQRFKKTFIWELVRRHI